MRYQILGYYLVCLSPLVSIILWVFGGYFIYTRPHYDYLLPILWHIGINVLIMGVQVCGTLLYLVGYRRRELEDLPLLLVSGILLSLWGLFTTYVAIALHNDFLEWIMQPDRRAITIWDNMEYATWGLKGLLWIASGLTFIATDIRERMA